MSKIIHVATESPDYEYETPDILAFIEKHWLNEMSPDLRRKARKIYLNTGIRKRRSAFPMETIFSDLTFQDRNDLYIKAAIELSAKALQKALNESRVAPEELDFLITTSCTGFMIPSVDAHLVNRLQLRRNIKRLPVTEMGCAGGTSALIYANDFLKANPGTKAAIVSVELPSMTFQRNDHSVEHLVSHAIFADGAAAVLMGESPIVAPRILDTDMYHFPDATHLMGFQLSNTGFKIILDRHVPDAIQEHFQNLFLPFLKRNNLQVEDVHNYMFHPGGKKIIERVEDFIGRFGKDISDSKAVLQERGNLSSATILHILERVMRKPHTSGELGYMLAFGPGFTGQSLLLKWE